MAFKTPEELIQFVEDDLLWFDVNSTIFVGNNNLSFSAMRVPEEMVSFEGNKIIIATGKKDEEGKEVTASFESDNPDFKVVKGSIVWIIMDKKEIHLEVFDPGTEKEEMDYSLLYNFLSNHKINTKGKLLKILKDGYQIYKDDVGVYDEYELHRDYMINELGDML